MDMAKRIKERRLQMKYTQEELAEKLGLQKSAIAKYENGRVENIKRSVIAKMSEVLECSPSYLMGWDDNTNAELDNIYPIELKKFPLLGEIACGTPIFANEDRESYVMAGTNIKADFCLKAKGDSMINARIMDGDIIFIRKETEIMDGQIYAVAIDDEVLLKRVYYDKEENIFQLISENPAYKPIILTGEKLEHITILGKAIAFQSDVI